MVIKIITFNIRYDKPDPGNFAWEVRKNAVGNLIYRNVGRRPALSCKGASYGNAKPCYNKITSVLVIGRKH